MEELASSGAIPGYWLYGDSPAPPVPRFLHAERIVARAPRHDWQIRPHRHADLFQAFLITQGGAELELEGGHQAIAAPWLLWLPAGTVHGFHFSPDTDGQIITVSTDFMSAVLSEQNLAEIGATLSAPLSCPAEREDLAPSFAAIARALTQDEGALHTTIEAHLKLLLVAFSALLAPDTPAGGREEPGALLFRRFRQLVEQQYRRQWPVSRYVRELGVSEDRLHASCHRHAGKPPRQVLQDRLLVEAQRDLIYTTLDVAQIAYGLGFRDAAYFSRFFSKRTGLPPAAFRRTRGKTVG
jgi:AraC family transcriptional activator of pobA